MVLARHIGDLQVAGLVGLAQQAERSGAGSGGHGLALQIGNALDARILLHQHAHVVAEDIGRKSHLFLALHQVGGRAALQIDRAVLHQRNAVARSHRLVIHLQVGQLQLGFDGIENLVADVHAVAHGLEVGIQVRETKRRLAVTQGDAARALDLVERGRALRHGARTCTHQGRNGHRTHPALFRLHIQHPLRHPGCICATGAGPDWRYRTFDLHLLFFGSYVP